MENQITSKQQQQKKFQESKVLGLFKELNPQDQGYIYGLIWGITAKDLIIRTSQDRINQLKTKMEAK